MSTNIYQINIQTTDSSVVRSFLMTWFEEAYGSRPQVETQHEPSISFFENETPSLFAVGKLHSGWITVLHDSYERLIKFNQSLSSQIEGMVVHTLGQSTVDTYYLSIHQNGELVRELYFGEDSDGIEQAGLPLSFEKHLPFPREEDYTYFDYEYLEAYGELLGIGSLIDLEEYKGAWEIIQKKQKKGWFSRFR
ncbi:hypothetical protein ACOJQI_02230 [Bacillus salacetis]|uniref:hypothetical protein n=1 Tax=Bacillus salacetis TaxID=2315464 RepID=UPI003B9DE6F5